MSTAVLFAQIAKVPDGVTEMLPVLPCRPVSGCEQFLRGNVFRHGPMRTSLGASCMLEVGCAVTLVNRD